MMGLTLAEAIRAQTSFETVGSYFNIYKERQVGTYYLIPAAYADFKAGIPRFPKKVRVAKNPSFWLSLLGIEEKNI